MAYYERYLFNHITKLTLVLFAIYSIYRRNLSTVTLLFDYDSITKLFYESIYQPTIIFDIFQ